MPLSGENSAITAGLTRRLAESGGEASLVRPDAPGAITYPKGFLAAGVCAGIKQHGEDLALIYSECPASSAGVFTTNVIKSAPVILSQSRLSGGISRAIVANSGNANACTGEQGDRDAREMTSQVAGLLSLQEQEVFVASTGIIGHPLPMDKVRAGIAQACASLDRDGGERALRGIMTTDTRPKECEIGDVSIGGAKVRIGGIAKGSGMIDPNLATMLSFITTDIAITPQMLQLALSRSAEISYNCLTVDGDTSTNDTVIALANGMAGNSIIDSEGPEFRLFQLYLDHLTMTLAQMIAADGEGATKFMEIAVEGASSREDCRRIAKTIANSPLVKTAAFGCDPNWGRILAAAGRSGVSFDPRSVNLFLGDIQLVAAGEPSEFSEQQASDYLGGPELLVRLQVGPEHWSARVWTCDFSYDYIRINADYHT